MGFGVMVEIIEGNGCSVIVFETRVGHGRSFQIASQIINIVMVPVRRFSQMDIPEALIARGEPAVKGGLVSAKGVV